MKKITIKDLSPVAEEIIVTGKIGDLSVRQYVKANNLVDEIVDMRLGDFSDNAVIEVLEDYLPEELDEGTTLKRAKEILEVTREEVEAELEMERQKADDWDAEHKFLKNELQGGIA
jgi:predicted HTH domain antitoxin